MQKNSKRAFVFAAAGAFFSAVLALACGLYLPRVGQQAQSMQASAERIDAFVRQPLASAFNNQAAQAAFGRDHTAARKEDDTLYTYTSPEGIAFISKSKVWNEEKLKALYHELLQNKHGKELLRLSQVVIYPQKDEFAAATHQNKMQASTLSFDFPSLPKGFNFTFQRMAGVITLYNGDRQTTVKSMASAMSHEYGHHYTFFHMFSDPGLNGDLLQSKYALLRGLDPGKALTDRSDDQFYYANHHWYLVEIAAEDYVTLMGSPNSRAIVDFYDIRDQLEGAKAPTYSARNDRVQENLLIPMASEKEGLVDYFYSFAEQPAPSFPEKKEIQIALQKNEKTYHLENGYETFINYELTWNKAYGNDAVYTLVTFDEENYSQTLYPIKTVRPGKEAVAYIGSVTAQETGAVRITSDGLATGTRSFAVTAILPDGTMYVSAPMRYAF